MALHPSFYKSQPWTPFSCQAHLCKILPTPSALFSRPRITKVHFKETQFELRVLGKDVSSCRLMLVTHRAWVRAASVLELQLHTCWPGHPLPGRVGDESRKDAVMVRGVLVPGRGGECRGCWLFSSVCEDRICTAGRYGCAGVCADRLGLKSTEQAVRSHTSALLWLSLMDKQESSGAGEACGRRLLGCSAITQCRGSGLSPFQND